jgi:hypothetical protein
MFFFLLGKLILFRFQYSYHVIHQTFVLHRFFFMSVMGVLFLLYAFFCSWEQPTFASDDSDDGNDDDDGYDNDGDDWYLGRVPAFRPNVAFSLYGVLKSDKKDTGCNKKTYINSFHTTRGVESFTNSMAAAGKTDLFSFRQGSGSADENQQNNGGSGNNNNRNDPTSTCYNSEASGDAGGGGGADAADDAAAGDYQGRQRYLNNGDDNSGYSFYYNQNDEYYYYNYENGAKFEPNAKSYGLGCTVSGSSSGSSSSSSKFALQLYKGYYCDANSIYGTKKTLQDFNARLEQAVCVPVYRAAADDTAATYNYGGAEDDESDEDGDSGSGDGMDDDNPLYLLATSKSCHVYGGDGSGSSCPDPYGKLRSYDVKLSRATGLVAGGDSWWTAQRVEIAGWLCITMGFLGTLFGLGLLLKEGISRCLRSRKNNSSKTLLDDGTDGIVQMVRDQSDLASASLRNSKKLLDDGVQMVRDQSNMVRSQSKMAAAGFVTAISSLAKSIRTKAAGAAERTRRRSRSPSPSRTKKESKRKKKSKKSSSSSSSSRAAAAAVAAAAAGAATVAASSAASDTENEDSKVEPSNKSRSIVDLDDDVQSTATGSKLDAPDDNADAEDHLSDFECYVTETPSQQEEAEEDEDQQEEESKQEEEQTQQTQQTQQEDEQTTQEAEPDYHLHEDEEDDDEADDFFDEQDDGTDNNNDDDSDDDTFDDGRDEHGNQRIFQRNKPAPRLRWLRTWRNRRASNSSPL